MSHTSDNSFSKLFLGLALAVATYSSGLGAAHAAGMNGDSVRVSLRGLDLHTSQGRAALRSRVHDAAVRACTAQEPGATADGETFADCVDEAVRGATPQVNQVIAAADRLPLFAAASVPAQ